MNEMIYYIAFVSFLLGMAIGAWVVEKQFKKKILNKENIVECFKDVDWSYQSFSANGVRITASDGTEHFYKAPPLDEAIKKLNKLINTWTR